MQPEGSIQSSEEHQLIQDTFEYYPLYVYKSG